MRLAPLALAVVLFACKGSPSRPEAPAVVPGPAGGEGPAPVSTVQAPPGMVHVPAGAFWMGCNETVDPSCGNHERPYHRVVLKGFFLDRTEVTVAAYADCAQAGGCTPAVPVGACNAGESDRGNFGINCVTWGQARSFCEWAGKRLPTEAEWEKGARGTDGRIYPWGSEAPDAGGTYRANWGDGLSTVMFMRDGFEYDAPVGKFPSGASPFGALDLAGNLAEWVRDGYADRYDPAADTDPAGPDGVPERVVRGGSWREPAKRIRASARDSHPPENWYDHVGFRCAKDPD